MVLAPPVSYQLSGIASGTIGATNFTNTPFEFTGTGDSDGLSQAGPGVFVNQLQEVSSNLQGIGTVRALDAFYFYVNQSIPGAGFIDEVVAWDVFDFGASDFASYDGIFSLGPISVNELFLAPFKTTQGSLVLTTVSNLTFVTLPNLWQGATSVGSGWYYLNWFGYFNTDNSPWIYHQTLGWLYPVGTSTDSIWFWDPAMNTHWWTSNTVYPSVYRKSDATWLYYDRGSSNPRLFYNFSTGKWEAD
jgi:hypothetical protein